MKFLAALLISIASTVAATTHFDVREHGAHGDGQSLDTAAIQKAVDACAEKGGGQVLFPPGRYVSGTIRLRSNVTLYLEAGARVIGTTNLTDYTQPATPDFMPEARWGKWHRGLFIGENIDDFAITGPGVIDGNKVFDPTGEEKMRGPHTIVLLNCRHFLLRDVTILDSANYAIYMQITDHVEIRDVKIVGGWDGVHWRGAPDHWCNDVKIIGCQLYTGDDAIAGRYWNDTVIERCLINSSCNGIRLIGPATRLTISNNLFRGPGEQPHRSSRDNRRTNMLSGIILQPGAWDRTRGPLDEVFIANNVMETVASPVTLWTKPGNPVGRVTISGLHATGVYRSAFSVENWSDTTITNVVFRDVHVQFNGGGKPWAPDQTVRGPGVDARPLPAWGLYTRGVQNLTFEDVRLSLAADDTRPVVFAENVGTLNLQNFKYPTIAGVTNSIITTNVTKIVQ